MALCSPWARRNRKIMVRVNAPSHGAFVQAEQSSTKHLEQQELERRRRLERQRTLEEEKRSQARPIKLIESKITVFLGPSRLNTFIPKYWA
jgi:hypothetical protein